MKKKLLLIVTVVTLLWLPNVIFGQAPNLGTASSFTLFTSVGAFNSLGVATIVTGDVGTNAGAFSGFPPGTLIGQKHIVDAVSLQAATDVGLAYNFLDGILGGMVIGTTLGGGQTLTPGVYTLGAASVINGDLFLNGLGDPNAIFIFQIDGALSTGVNSRILMINSATSCNVFWQINGAANLGTDSEFRGTILGNGEINFIASAVLEGRGLTQAGAINIPSSIVATGCCTDNRWTGNVNDDWKNTGNWNLGLLPNCGWCNKAIIPVLPPGKPYPVVQDIGMTGGELIIENGANLTINPGKDLTVCGNTSINGPDALYLRSDGISGNASFVTTEAGTISYDITGSVAVELFLHNCIIGPGNSGCWHFVSPPVSGAMSEVFTGDYVKYWDEVAGTWSADVSNTNFPLEVMHGYLVSNPVDEIRTFHGQLNDGSITSGSGSGIVSLTRTVGTGDGWNIVGNPYPSEIDLTSPGALIDWTNIDKVVYYYDQQAGNYKAYNIITGLGPGSPKIPSMQGFFVHVNANPGTLKFTDDNRTTIGTVNFYKNLQNNIVWLKVEGVSGMNDEVIVSFHPDVTGGYDQDKDCLKLPGANVAPQLCAISTDNQKLAIDALPFSGVNTVVPLEFYVSHNGTGNYSITASSMESFPAGTKITLEDTKTGTSQVLTTNPVFNFSYNDGENSARFLLHVFNPSLGINDQDFENGMRIYSSGKDVYLNDQSGNPEKGDIFLYNMMGQKISQGKVENITLNKFTFNLPDGYYLVRVIIKDKIFNRKVYLN